MANTKENTNKQQHHQHHPHQQQGGVVNSTMMRQPQQYSKRAEGSTMSSQSPPPPPSPSPSSISNSSSRRGAMFSTKRKNIKLSKLYPFIGETYCDLKKYISNIDNDVNSQILTEIINKYRKGCNEVHSDALEYSEVSRMLSTNIVRVLDLLKDMSTTCINLDEYHHRVCELIAIFISCELRVSVDADEDEHLLTASRIVYTMRKHLTQDDKEATRYNVLRTLVYIPRFFNAREIMCAIFESLIPLKAATEVTQLSDKLYMLYIIVFYRWMLMQKYNDGQQFIVNFAEGFMKPKVSLCTNMLYCQHLARYTRHSAATRTILNDMKFYTDLRNACIIDNAFKVSGSIVVNLCEDDDVIELDESEVLTFAELFSAVQLESAKTSVGQIKREQKTIVDSVDLTVDDDDENSAAVRSKLEKHEKWLENFELLAKQYRELQERQERKEKPTKVICLDSDSEGGEVEEVVDVLEEVPTTAKETTTSIPNKSTAGPTVNNSTSLEEPEDLFEDSYPITVTPIDCNADLETSNNEDDDETQLLPPRLLPLSLRTYVAKKGSSCSVSSAEGNVYRPPGQQGGVGQSVAYGKSLPAKKIAYRRNTLHICSSTPTNRRQSDDESSSDDCDNNNRPRHSSSAKKQPVKSMGPGVPYASLKSTFGGGKVIFSQAMPSCHNFSHSDSHEEQSSTRKSEHKSKRVHFDSSPMGPTAAYSKQKLLSNKTPMPSPNNNSTNCAETSNDYFQAIGGGGSFNCGSSLAGSSTTSTNTGSVSNVSSTAKQQEEHRAAAATLFRNIFDRPHNKRSSSYSSNYSSMLSPNSSLPIKPGMLSCRFEEQQLKNNILKCNRLKQRRATICARSDLNDYTAPECSPTRNNQGPYQNFDWEGAPLKGNKVSDHMDVAADLNVIQVSNYQDKKLSKRCAVVIKPTEELLQYERKRDAMYNEILQKQRRKLELRAMEKMKEKERRRQEKQQKREQFQREQSETMKQLERMNLSSKSDEEETAAGSNIERDQQPPQVTANIELIEIQLNLPTSPRCTPEKRRWEDAADQLSDSESPELPPAKRATPEKCLPEAQNSQPDPEFIVESQPVQNQQRNPSPPHETEQQLELDQNAPPSAENLNVTQESSVKTDEKSQTKPKMPRVRVTKNETGPPKKSSKNVTTKSKSIVEIPTQIPPLTQNYEEADLDQIPLLQRKGKSKKLASQKPQLISTETVPPESQKQIERSTPTPSRPKRECRQSVKLADETSVSPAARPTPTRRRSLFVSSPSNKQQDVEQTTDSEVEAPRQPARISKGRRKSLYAQNSANLKDFEVTTDSERESDQRPPSVLRQSPRFSRERVKNTPAQSPLQQKMIEQQSDTEKESQTTLSTNMSPPKTTKRMSKLNSPNKVQSTEENIKQGHVETLLPENDLSLALSSAKEAELNEQSIVAVIAKSLSSPDTTPIHKEFETSEHEEILESLEDLLAKENRLRAQLNEISDEGSPEYNKSYEIVTFNTTNDIQPAETGMTSTEQLTSNVSEAETEPLTSNVSEMADVDMHSVIENIVLNEIQREMDAESVNISKTVQPVTETELTSYSQDEVKTFVTLTSHEDQILHSKRIVINFEDEVLEEMLGNSLPIPHANGGCGDLGTAQQTHLPLLITNVESLSNLQDDDIHRPRATVKCIDSSSSAKPKEGEKKSRQKVLVTENIFLGNGCRLETETVSREEGPEECTIVAPGRLLNGMESFEVPPTLPSTEHDAPYAHMPDMPLLEVFANPSTKSTAPIIAKGNQQNVSLVLDSKVIKNTAGNEDDNTRARESKIQPGKTTPKTNDDEDQHSKRTQSSPINEIENKSPHSPGQDDKQETEKTADEEQYSTRTQSSPTKETDNSSQEFRAEDNKRETKNASPSEATQGTSDGEQRTTRVVSPPRNEEVLPSNPLKTKASLKNPNLKRCHVNVERLSMSKYTKFKQLKKELSLLPAELMAEDDRSITSSPTETVGSNVSMEDCGKDTAAEHTASDKSLNSAVHEENTEVALGLLGDDESNQEPKHDDNDLVSEATLTLETTSTSPEPAKTKSKSRKTVTFNLVAEIIPCSPRKRYSSPNSIEDREQTPPGDYRWNYDDEMDAERIHRYYCPLSMVTPATRKHFNDDLMTTSNTSTSCSSTDSEDEVKKPEENKKKMDEDIYCKQLNGETVSPSDDNNDFHSFPEYVTEEIVVETSNHTFATQANEPMMMDQMVNGALMTIETADETVPVYLFSDEIVDLVPADSILVSSTYVTSAGGDILKVMGNKSLMSPSEQEVSSTQESFFQSPNKTLTKEDKSLPETMPKATATQSSNTVEDKTSSSMLQNNQVDTTNHSPEMSAPPSLKNKVNSVASSTITTSSQATKTKRRRCRRKSSYEERPKSPARSKDKSKIPKDSKSSNESTKKKSSTFSNDSKTSSSDRNTMENWLKKKVSNDIITNLTTAEGGRNSPSTTSGTDKPKEPIFRIPKIKSVLEINESFQRPTPKVSGARNPFVVRSIQSNAAIPGDSTKEVIQKKQKGETAKPEHSLLANKDVATTKPNSEKKLQHKQKTTGTAKSEGGGSLVSEAKSKPQKEVRPKKQKPPSGSLANVHLANAKTKPENVGQPTDTTATAKSEPVLDKEELAQQKTVAKKRESSSVASNERKMKKVTELQDTIDVEIHTMATALSIPKSIAEELETTAKSKVKQPSKDPKSKEKRKYTKSANASTKSHEKRDEVVAVSLIKVQDLREPTTTGIKSAVSHGSRKYSPKKSSGTNGNSLKAAKNPNKPNVDLTTTRNSSSAGCTYSSKSTKNSTSKTAATAVTAATVSHGGGSSSNHSDKSSSNNSNKPTAAKTTTNEKAVIPPIISKPNSTANGGGTSSTAVAAVMPPAIAVNSSSTSSTSESTTNAHNHVRKKQRTK